MDQYCGENNAIGNAEVVNYNNGHNQGGKQHFGVTNMPSQSYAL